MEGIHNFEPLHKKLEQELNELADRITNLTTSESDSLIARSALIDWIKKYEQEYLPSLLADGKNVSHTFDTPLSVTYGFAMRELLAREIPRYNWNNPD